MPQIGWFEILVIVVIAILVIGPKDFPVVLRKIGNWINAAKTYFANLTSNIDEITNLGIQKVWERDLELTDILIEDVLEKGLEIASPTNDEERSSIVSIKMPAGFDTGEVVRKLQDDYGILVTNRSGFLRVSPHIDNNKKEIDFFLTSLFEILNL